MSQELDGIWKGDFFERRKEAELLEQYLESAWKRPNLREDSKGFVLAVDADYGMGKTFFLKRFSDQMAMNHPVAYIDAWKDDLHDEPLIALLATLEEALKPYFGKKPVVEEQFKTVIKRAQKVGGLMAKGIAFRALGAIFTPKIVDFIADTLSSNETQIDEETLETRINEAEKDTIKGAGKVSEIIKEESDLRSRISKFKESKSAIEDMKNALRQLVESLKTNDEAYAPIVIIIDELDRCRPTYAIKLLEEVKHLFDVEGLVFVLGTSLVQLTHSVSALYGESFEGHAYLNRFIERVYRLKTPDLRKITEYFIERSNFPENTLDVFQTYNERNASRDSSYFKHIMTDIIEVFEFSPRELFKLLEILECSSQAIARQKILIQYYIPLVIKLYWPDKFNRLSAAESDRIKIAIPKVGGEERVNISDFFQVTRDYLLGSYKEPPDENTDEGVIYSFLTNRAFSHRFHESYARMRGLAHPKNYEELINFVQRIEHPAQ